MDTRVALDGDGALLAPSKTHCARARKRVAPLLRRAYHIVSGIKAVGHHGTPARTRKLCRAGVVAAHHHAPVLTHKLHELNEGALNLLKRTVVIKMVGLDIGDHCHMGLQIEEGAIGLVSLGYKVGARAIAPVGVVALHNAADEEAWIAAHAVEHGGAHGRRGGFAMGAGNGNSGIAVAQGGEHFRARPHGDAQLARPHQLGLVSGMAVETTTTSGVTSSMVSARWPTRISTPARRSCRM